MLAAALTLALLPGAAPPPAKMTREQGNLLREREAYFKTSSAAWTAGRHADAIADMRKVLENEVRALGALDREAENTASQLAGWHRALGEWAEEAEMRRFVLEARRRVRGPDDWKTTDARHALEEALRQPKRTPAQRETIKRAAGLHAEAAALYRAGRPREALPLIRRVLELREGVLGERHPDYTEALNDLGLLTAATGDVEGAVPILRKALALRKEVLGERHPDTALTLNNLALQHRALGDIQAASRLLRQALAIRREVRGERSVEYAASLHALATLQQSAGDLGAALLLFQKAMAIHADIVGERHNFHAACLHAIAVVHHLRGDYQAALAPLKQSLALTRELLGERHRDYAAGLNNLAGLHIEMGDHRAALPLLKKAAEVVRAALGERHPDYASSLNNLAQLHKAMGDDRAALPLQLRAVEIRKWTQGERHPEYALALSNLAGLHRRLGHDGEALAGYKKALALWKAASGEKTTQYANGLNDLALLLTRQRRYEAALPLFTRALAIHKAAVGEGHHHHSACLANLAALHHTMGAHRAAVPLYERVAEDTGKSLGENHYRYADALHMLGRVRLALKDHAGARRLSEQALEITEARLRSEAGIQSDRQQLAAAAAFRHQLDLRLSLPDAAAHAHLLAWKGAVLLRQRQRRLHARLAASPATRDAAERLRQVTLELAALSAAPRPGLRLGTLTTEQEALQAALFRLSAEARDARDEARLTSASLSAAIPGGAALVDYVVHWQAGLLDKDGRPVDERRLTAFVLRKGEAVARVDLGPVGPVDAAVLAWRAHIVAGRAGGGAALKALVWSPLQKHLGAARVVLVSPDGALATVPFAALPGAMEGTYLIEDVALGVVPVPSMLPALLAGKAGRAAPSLLCVGGVDYDAGVAEAGEGRPAPLGVSRSWTPLPAAAAEAASVRRAFAAHFKGGEVTGLSKGEATRPAVRKALASVRFAHLATHGFFAPDSARNALGAQNAGLFARDDLTGWHPLLLSGLAFAGANNEPKAGEEDGILTALEVSEMDLSKLDLAVLSACETGLGKEAAGEGVLGLQRAFAVAGARSVVASLWSVDDKATQALMGDFYAHAWGAKGAVPLAEALRRAQVALLNGKAEGGALRGVGLKPEAIKEMAKGARVPPYYWAAFVLSGDWR